MATRAASYLGVEYRRSPGLALAVLVDGRLIGHLERWTERVSETASRNALFIPLVPGADCTRFTAFAPRELAAWMRAYAGQQASAT